MLYGTDMGYNQPMFSTTFRILETHDEHFYAQDLSHYHWPLYGFGLPDAVLKKVYADNARKVFQRAEWPRRLSLERRGFDMQKCALKCLAGLGIRIVAGWLLALPGAAQQLANRQLALTAHAPDGSYELSTRGTAAHTVLRAGVSARIDGQWVRSRDYPQRRQPRRRSTTRSAPAARSGHMHRDWRASPIWSMCCRSTIAPYGAVQVELRNHGPRLRVQSLRSVEAIGQPAIDLGGRARRPHPLRQLQRRLAGMGIYDLGAPGGMHRGVGSQLIYNRKSRQSLFLGAVTADRC